MKALFGAAFVAGLVAFAAPTVVTPATAAPVQAAAQHQQAAKITDFSARRYYRRYYYGYRYRPYYRPYYYPYYYARPYYYRPYPYYAPYPFVFGFGFGRWW